MRPTRPVLLALLLLAPLVGGCPNKHDAPPAAEASAAPDASAAPAEGAKGAEGAKAGEGAKADEGAPVKLAKVERQPIGAHLDAPATVVALPERTAAVAASASARVLAIAVHPGQAVQAGQVIARLAQDPTPRADYDKARVTYGQAQAERDRQWRLFRAGVGARLPAEQADAALAIARSDLDAKAAALRLSSANETLRAPIAGIVTALAGSVGQAAEPATPLATITDLRRVGLEAQLAAASLGAVRAGGAASVRTPWGEALPATIIGLQRGFDPATQRGKLLAAADNPGGRLAVGMFVTLEIAGGRHEGLAVPASAVIPRDTHAVVYVVDHGVAHERPVTVGATQPGNRVEIVTGLHAGEDVATEGGYLLAEGAKVKVGE